MVIVANCPKVSILPDGSTSSGNYGLLFVLYKNYINVTVIQQDISQAQYI
jgi:hypothetical protein